MTTGAAVSLRDAVRVWQRAMAHKDVEQIASFYAEDAIAMYPRHLQPTYGHAGNREAWNRYFCTFDTHPITTDLVITATSGEMGYSLGRYANAEREGPGAEGGRFVAVWRYNEGQWKIALLSAHVHEDIAPFPFKEEDLAEK